MSKTKELNPEYANELIKIVDLRISSDLCKRHFYKNDVSELPSIPKSLPYIAAQGKPQTEEKAIVEVEWALAYEREYDFGIKSNSVSKIQEIHSQIIKNGWEEHFKPNKVRRIRPKTMDNMLLQVLPEIATIVSHAMIQYVKVNQIPNTTIYKNKGGLKC